MFNNNDFRNTQESRRINILRRPEQQSYKIKDGSHVGTLEFVHVWRNKYLNRDTLSFRVQLEDEEGYLFSLFFAPVIDWHYSSKLFRTLEALDSVPYLGEEIDLDDFIGMKVFVEIKNHVKRGQAYHNIVSLEKHPHQNLSEDFDTWGSEAI